MCTVKAKTKKQKQKTTKKKQQKPTTKKFVGFYNHSPLLTMVIRNVAQQNARFESNIINLKIFTLLTNSAQVLIHHGEPS